MPNWDGDRDKGGTGNKGKDKGICKGICKGKRETRYCYDCREQVHIGVNCQTKWTNGIDEEDDQGSSWESEPEGEKTEEVLSLEVPDDEGKWCWPKRNGITIWGKTSGPTTSMSLPLMTRTSRCLED